jgi:hypothetical protein
MKQTPLFQIVFGCLLLCPLSIGCGGSGQPETIAEGDEIEQFLAENPEMAVDMEEESGLLEADSVEEGE